MKPGPNTLALALVLGFVIACTKPEGPPAQTRTKAQRDSALGQSGLPGSAGILKAMNAADSAKARQAKIDSAGKP